MALKTSIHLPHVHIEEDVSDVFLYLERKQVLKTMKTL